MPVLYSLPARLFPCAYGDTNGFHRCYITRKDVVGLVNEAVIHLSAHVFELRYYGYLQTLVLHLHNYTSAGGIILERL